MAGFVRGFDELERNLRALGPEVATRIGNTATRKAAKVMESAFKGAAPDGTRGEGEKVGGRTHHKIKNSLKVKKGRSKGGPDATVYVVHTGAAFHSLFIEKGTSKMTAKPWMGDAFGANVQTALNAIAKELERGIARKARR